MIENNIWPHYHSIHRPPRIELIKFLNSLPKDKVNSVIDLGCGGFYDSKYLAQQGYKVTAIDSTLDETRQKEFLSSLTEEQRSNVCIEKQCFENLNLPKADLLYSFYSMPFCKKERFANQIINIAKSINPNGYFLGNFFANGNMLSNDEKSAREFSQEQISNLFDYLGFESKVTTYEGQKTAKGDTPDENHNLTFILVRGKAPEQLPDLDPDKIDEILGIAKSQKEFNTETFTTGSTYLPEE